MNDSNHPPAAPSERQLLTLLGWRTTAARWREFWDRWAGPGKIQDAHWLQREPKYLLHWHGGELDLEVHWYPAEGLDPETWGLSSMTLHAPTPPHRPWLEWWGGIDPSQCTRRQADALFGPVAREEPGRASYFVNGNRGGVADMAIELTWLEPSPECPQLCSALAASMGTLVMAPETPGASGAAPRG